MSHSIFSVFGNRVRTKFILCLADKPKNVTQIIRTCGLSQSAVSQHLAKLKLSGLVATKKTGKEILYSLKNKKAAAVSRALLTLDKEVR